MACRVKYKKPQPKLCNTRKKDTTNKTLKEVQRNTRQATTNNTKIQ